MTTGLQKSAQDDLRRLIDQIERLESEKAAIAEDIASKMKEAKGSGFDTKILKKVLALRKKSKTERDEEEALLATYCHALGMAGTPMGDYIDREDEAKAKKIARSHGISESIVDELVERAP